jgi:hypothetical protein
MPSSRFLEKRDQDPRHCSTIITPQPLTPERCLTQPGQMGPQNQVTGNGVYQEVDIDLAQMMVFRRLQM